MSQRIRWTGVSHDSVIITKSNGEEILLDAETYSFTKQDVIYRGDCILLPQSVSSPEFHDVGKVIGFRFSSIFGVRGEPKSVLWVRWSGENWGTRVYEILPEQFDVIRTWTTPSDTAPLMQIAALKE
jgi:hypothetical protein